VLSEHIGHDALRIVEPVSVCLLDNPLREFGLLTELESGRYASRMPDDCMREASVSEFWRLLTGLHCVLIDQSCPVGDLEVAGLPPARVFDGTAYVSGIFACPSGRPSEVQETVALECG
jgi:hypothetical protein